jgi:CDP-paratose 2-epimerase
MKIVLITGAAGLVGSESALFFLNKGFKVLGIDNNYRKFFFGKDGDTSLIKKKLIKYSKNYKHYNCNILNKYRLEVIFKKFKKNIKIIIHAAAQPSHDWSYSNPILDFKVNSLGTLNLLELTKKYSNKAVFIYLSTNKIYGDNPNKLSFNEYKNRWDLNKNNKFYKGIDEKFLIDNCIHSLFGVSKSYADLAVQEYGKNLGLKTVCFRAGCITGPNHSGAKLHGFLSFLVKSCIKNKSYNLIGYKGKQVRDNIHSFDLVNCFWEFYNNPKTSGVVYNIGGGRFSNCSVLEAIEYVEYKLNIKIKKIFTIKPRIGDHQWYITDLTKFKKDYPNWKQKYNTKMIIDEILDSYTLY